MGKRLAAELRLSGGVYGKRRLLCPPGEIRPAMARMRESLFAILAERLQGASFLDLFCGSGLMALEAASRGASLLTLVEADRGKQAAIRQNLALLSQGEQASLWLMPAERFLARRPQQSYQIIYVDPPFPFPHKEEILQLVARRCWLAPTGVLIIHHPRQQPLPELVASTCDQLQLYDRRFYGGSQLSFYRQLNTQQPTLGRAG